MKRKEHQTRTLRSQPGRQDSRSLQRLLQVLLQQMAHGQPDSCRPGLLEHGQRSGVVERECAARNPGGRQRERSPAQRRSAEDWRLLGRLHGRKRHRSRRAEAAAAGTGPHRSFEVQERHHAGDRSSPPPVSRSMGNPETIRAILHSSASPASRTTTMLPKSWRRSIRAGSAFPTATTTWTPTTNRTNFSRNIARTCRRCSSWRANRKRKPQPTPAS